MVNKHEKDITRYVPHNLALHYSLIRELMAIPACMLKQVKVVVLVLICLTMQCHCIRTIM